MPFAAALSEHPDTAHAIGEITGQVLEALPAPPDLALLFVTQSHAEAYAAAVDVVESVLEPGVLVGCTAASVLANGREAEEAPAATLWAGCFGDVVPFRLDSRGSGRLSPWFDPSAVLVIGDPFSFDAEYFFDAIEERWPGLPVIGGMASAATVPGGSTLTVDGELFADGAVGVLLGPGVEVEAIVSQGCRPIGHPYAVTAAEGNLVRELGGQPAMKRLIDLARDELSPDELASVNRGGLHIGQAVNETKVDLGRGDFIVRNLVGASERQGWIALNEPVAVGETLQYQLRDADSADDDLRALLTGRAADAALVFTCTARGSRLFGEADHDAAVVHDYLGRPPAAGFFAAGEFGPVSGRNFVHGFTASIALLRHVRGVGSASEQPQ